MTERAVMLGERKFLARRGSELGLALLLSLLMMAACLAIVAREMELVLPYDRVTASLGITGIAGSRLGWQLAAFTAALTMCHLLIGLAAFALAQVTEWAFPGGSRARRLWLVAGWFTLLAVIVMAANSTWYPGSMFTGGESWWRGETFGFHPVVILAGSNALVFAYLVWRTMLRLDRRTRLYGAGVAAAGLLALIMGPKLAAASRVPDAAAPASDGQPNIVIIGIDALRNDLSVPRQRPARAPHIADFLSGARRFTDTTSPLPRTFGAWVSILTGRHPVSTNARVNLMPRRLVREGATLGDALRERGYRAIYSTDEVRFANIDESYGFDQLITPPIGAADFLLGYAGDMPVVNIVASTRFGRALFPSNHANRAVAITYEPEDFVARLEDEISVAGPTLLSIHLTLPHWPYSWAGMRAPNTPQAYRPAYGRAVEEVDGQFASIMELLARKGVLDNAIVVLLSDHGEALGGETDSMLRGTGNSREIWDSLWGHGTSVLSPHQYSVLLALRPFGRAELPGSPGEYDWPVSLEDVRPTLEHYVVGRPPDNVDGVSLLPYLSNARPASELATRVRFTETDFNTPSILAGHYEASRLVDEATVYYKLDRDSGWVEFREDRLPEVLARKQRAAISPTMLLAEVPGPDGEGPRFLLSDRLHPSPAVLEGPPDATHAPEARRLWDALKARFPGELPLDSGLP